MIEWSVMEEFPSVSDAFQCKRRQVMRSKFDMFIRYLNSPSHGFSQWLTRKMMYIAFEKSFIYECYPMINYTFLCPVLISIHYLLLLLNHFIKKLLLRVQHCRVREWVVHIFTLHTHTQTNKQTRDAANPFPVSLKAYLWIVQRINCTVHVFLINVIYFHFLGALPFVIH